MAYATTVTLDNAPWRDVPVQIHARSKVGIECRAQIKPFPDSAPFATVLATDTGSLVCTETNAAVVLGGGNAGLRFVAAEAGEDGNDITVEIVDPAAADEALDVTETTGAIVVTLATDGDEAITSTASQVKAAVEAEADDVVAVFLVGDGTGVVAIADETNLASGDDALAAGNYTAAGQDPDGNWRFREFSFAG